MFEKFYKKGREAYVIELIVMGHDWEMKPIIWDDDHSRTPKSFKTKAEASRFATELLNGQTTYTIVAFTIRKVTLTVPKDPNAL